MAQSIGYPRCDDDGDVGKIRQPISMALDNQRCGISNESLRRQIARIRRGRG